MASLVSAAAAAATPGALAGATATASSAALAPAPSRRRPHALRPVPRPSAAAASSTSSLTPGATSSRSWGCDLATLHPRPHTLLRAVRPSRPLGPSLPLTPSSLQPHQRAARPTSTAAHPPSHGPVFGSTTNSSTSPSHPTRPASPGSSSPAPSTSTGGGVARNTVAPAAQLKPHSHLTFSRYHAPPPGYQPGPSPSPSHQPQHTHQGSQGSRSSNAWSNAGPLSTNTGGAGGGMGGGMGGSGSTSSSGGGGSPGAATGRPEPPSATAAAAPPAPTSSGSSSSTSRGGKAIQTPNPSQHSYTQVPSGRAAPAAPASSPQPVATATMSSGGGSGAGSESTAVSGTAAGGRTASCRTMLERLYIRDFALVSEQDVELGPGVTVITGESGSGKSVLVEAFSQVLGAPAPQECVRAPADMALIEGTFLLGPELQHEVRELLAPAGLPARAVPPEPGSAEAAAVAAEGWRLTVRREIAIAPGGGLRSRVFLNGAASSLRVLRELGQLLVDSNGQHSALALRDPETQLDLLDRIAGTSPLADAYVDALSQLRSVESRLDELADMDDEEERARMQKLVDAVAKLRVEPGEERELRRTLKKMEARRSAVEQCGLVRMALIGDAGAGGVTDALRTIEAQLNTILAQEEQNAAAKRLQAMQQQQQSGAAGAAGPGGARAGEGEGEGEEGEEEEGEGEEGAGAGAKMMEAALEQVAAAKDMLAQAEGMVRAYSRRYHFSQADHDATSDRLQRIERLMRQAANAGFGAAGGGGHGGRRRGAIGSTEELLEASEGAAAKLRAYYEMEGQREEWEDQLDELAATIRRTALQLSARRRAAAAALRTAVEGCLKELAMGGSRFDVRIGWAEAHGAAADEGLWVGEEEAEEAAMGELGGRTYVMGHRGLDQVEFLLAAGPAEPLRPLAAVASGGESARVMLALKAAPAQAAAAAPLADDGAGTIAPASSGGLPILILDELDSGIGARLGSAVGSILARMAAPYTYGSGTAAPTRGSTSQVICVTHLPQVACYASQHIKVQKEAAAIEAAPESHAEHAQHSEGQGLQGGGGGGGGGRITTVFRRLEAFEERCEEVAAMLGLDYGVAEEMLRSAQQQVAAMWPGHQGHLGQGDVRAAQPAPQRASGRGGGSARGGARAAAAAASTGGAVMAAAAPRSGAAVEDEAQVDAPGNTGQGAWGQGKQQAAGRNGGYGQRESQEDDEEEAAMSAQLFAGVEAAALAHLERMESQAKAAAAAAAAAAGMVAQPAAAAVVAAVPEAAVARAHGRGAGPADADAWAALGSMEGSDEEQMEAPLAVMAEADHAPSAVMAAVAAEAPSAVAAAVEPMVTEAEAEGSGSGEVPQPLDEPVESVSSLLQAVVWAPGPGAPVHTADPVAGVPVGSGSRSSSSGPLVVAVHPADDLPLSLPLAGGPDGLYDREQGQAAAAAAAVEGASCGTSECEDLVGGPLQYDAARQSYDETAVQPHFGPSVTVTMDEAAGAVAGAGMAFSEQEAASYPEGRYEEHEQYTFNGYQYKGFTVSYGSAGGGSSAYDLVAGQYAYGSAYDAGVAGDADAGGRFVVVPLGHENEFAEMFQSISAFSREDYEGEAMRSYEHTLWRALRDAGAV